MDLALHEPAVSEYGPSVLESEVIRIPRKALDVGNGVEKVRAFGPEQPAGQQRNKAFVRRQQPVRAFLLESRQKRLDGGARVCLKRSDSGGQEMLFERYSLDLGFDDELLPRGRRVGPFFDVKAMKMIGWNEVEDFCWMP